jgi:hypothetical protein
MQQHTDVRQTGPEQPVSWVTDNYGNRIERYEADGVPRLAVTLSGRGPRKRVDVEAWYWAHVGTIQAPLSPPDQLPDIAADLAGEWQEDREHPAASLYRPEAAAVYDGTPGSGSIQQTYGQTDPERL